MTVWDPKFNLRLALRGCWVCGRVVCCSALYRVYYALSLCVCMRGCSSISTSKAQTSAYYVDLTLSV